MGEKILLTIKDYTVIEEERTETQHIIYIVDYINNVRRKLVKDINP